jgi:hypothetical protein
VPRSPRLKFFGFEHQERKGSKVRRVGRFALLALFVFKRYSARRLITSVQILEEGAQFLLGRFVLLIDR